MSRTIQMSMPTEPDKPKQQQSPTAVEWVANSLHSLFMACVRIHGPRSKWIGTEPLVIVYKRLEGIAERMGDLE